jgi:hypothetical protein
MTTLACVTGPALRYQARVPGTGTGTVLGLPVLLRSLAY